MVSTRCDIRLDLGSGLANVPISACAGSVAISAPISVLPGNAVRYERAASLQNSLFVQFWLSRHSSLREVPLVSVGAAQKTEFWVMGVLIEGE